MFPNIYNNMTTVKLAKSTRDLLMQALEDNEPAILKLSSRMLVDPKEGVNGSVTLPLTKTQISKLGLSQRATNFKLSRSQIMKLKKGSGFFGSLWKGVKSVGEAVGKTALSVGKTVAEDALKTAIQAAPALLMMGAGVGTASIKGTQGLGAGGYGGERGHGRVIKRGGAPLPESKTYSKFYVSGT